MNQDSCSICTREFAISICLCKWPPSLLCQQCLPRHKIEKSEGHQCLPISMKTSIPTFEALQTVKRRLSNLEQAKLFLENDCNQTGKAAEMVDDVCLQAVAAIDSLKTQAKGNLTNLERYLRQMTAATLTAVEANVCNEAYRPVGSFGEMVWAYVTGVNQHLTNIFYRSIAVDQSSLSEIIKIEYSTSVPELAGFNTIARSKENEIRQQCNAEMQNREANWNTALENVKAEQQRISAKLKLESDAAIARLTKNINSLTAERDDLKKRLKDKSDRKQSDALLNDWKKALFFEVDWVIDVIRCPFTICWPYFGTVQYDVLQSIPHEKDGWRPALGCVYTSLLCCVGAAINRKHYREVMGIRGSFKKELGLYCLHVFNFCLTKQEKNEKKERRFEVSI